jgi:hypothetical protein
MSAATTAAAAAAATSAAAVTASTATASRAIFTRTRLIDCQSAPIEILPIQRLDRRFGAFFRFHGDKCEPARATAKFVLDEIHFNDWAMRGEQVLKLVLGCVEGKVSHKQFCTHDDLLFD